MAIQAQTLPPFSLLRKTCSRCPNFCCIALTFFCICIYIFIGHLNVATFSMSRIKASFARNRFLRHEIEMGLGAECITVKSSFTGKKFCQFVLRICFALRIAHWGLWHPNMYALDGYLINGTFFRTRTGYGVYGIW